MTCHIVTFDVKNDDSRGSIYERLKSYGTYCPIHDNCWAIVTDQTAVMVRDHLMEIIESPDKIFVIKSGIESAWSSTYGQGNVDWLKEKL